MHHIVEIVLTTTKRSQDRNLSSLEFFGLFCQYCAVCYIEEYPTTRGLIEARARAQFQKMLDGKPFFGGASLPLYKLQNIRFALIA